MSEIPEYWSLMACIISLFCLNVTTALNIALLIKRLKKLESERQEQ